MATDKPKQWKCWLVYALIGLLLTIGPYVGAYMLLGERFASLPSSDDFLVQVVYRKVDRHILRDIFGPLAWVEAKVRGKIIILMSPDETESYAPGW